MKYKIIIPKEEDFELVSIGEETIKLAIPMIQDKEEHKQETVEQAAEKFYPPKTTDLICSPKLVRDSFIAGAKWQQEQNKNLYSEEDLKEAFIEGALTDLFNTWDISDKDMAKEKYLKWFERYKKK